MIVVVVCDWCIHTYAFYVGLDWKISDEGLCLDASINWQLAMGAEALGTTCMCICQSLIIFGMSINDAKCCDLN